jgi:hypothetical protein
MASIIIRPLDKTLKYWKERGIVNVVCIASDDGLWLIVRATRDGEIGVKIRYKKKEVHIPVHIKTVEFLDERKADLPCESRFNSEYDGWEFRIVDSIKFSSAEVRHIRAAS